MGELIRRSLRAVPFLVPLFKAAVSWSVGRASSHGAAISFYALFSLAPMLVIIIAIAGSFYDRSYAESLVFEQLKAFVGENGAKQIEEMLAQAAQPRANRMATMIGIGVLVFASTSMLTEVRETLNQIFRAVPRHKPIINYLVSRGLSLALVLALSLLLLLTLLLAATLDAFGAYLPRIGILIGVEEGLETLNVILSFGITTVLFTLVYAILPDQIPKLRHLFGGAIVASLLFAVGKFGISLYLATTGVATAFGAAGAVVALLIWVYWSAQIFLFGAEFAFALGEFTAKRDAADKSG